MLRSTQLCVVGLIALAAFFAAPALALKYAEPEHHLSVDPEIPSWKPGPLTIAPEEQLNLVGADVMDEITLGWVKMFRKAYPKLSVTMEARASGTGGPALTEGRAHLAPVGRELLPPEEKAFVEKFGYQPFAIRVATGSRGSLGKTAASVVLVDKNNPIKGLTLAQLDAIYSKTRLRGNPDIKTWGDLGLTGEWAARPIQFVKGKGGVHAFTVAAEDMGQHPGGLTYALLANVTPNVKVLPLADNPREPFADPSVENVYSHRYPLSRYVYIFVNRPPGKPLEPKVKEFLKAVLSRDGQDIVAKEGVYIPLTPQVVREELAKLE
jgi:phosphate transport system substrate-binding protein